MIQRDDKKQLTLFIHIAQIKEKTIEKKRYDSVCRGHSDHFSSLHKLIIVSVEEDVLWKVLMDLFT